MAETVRQRRQHKIISSAMLGFFFFVSRRSAFCKRWPLIQFRSLNIVMKSARMSRLTGEIFCTRLATLVLAQRIDFCVNLCVAARTMWMNGNKAVRSAHDEWHNQDRAEPSHKHGSVFVPSIALHYYYAFFTLYADQNRMHEFMEKTQWLFSAPIISFSAWTLPISVKA